MDTGTREENSEMNFESRNYIYTLSFVKIVNWELLYIAQRAKLYVLRWLRGVG